MTRRTGMIAFTLMLQAGMAAAQGLAPSNAASPGVAVAGIIECGAGYNSHELYDVKINVLEVVRGEKALELAKAKSQAPDAGFDYVLAKVKFEYFARGTPGDCNHELKPGQFVALSSEGKKYAAAALTGLKPELNATVRPGQSAEGWVAFLVPQADKKPLMTFTVNDAGADQHGGDMWFQLY